jgi:hypothetical protein
MTFGSTGVLKLGYKWRRRQDLLTRREVTSQLKGGRSP